jgi:hypothetical protein
MLRAEKRARARECEQRPDIVADVNREPHRPQKKLRSANSVIATQQMRATLI